MKRIPYLVLLAAIALAAFAASGAHALECSPDRAPAKRLLVPWFEVDLKRSKGTDTEIRVSNTKSYPVVVRARVATDLGHETLAFDFALLEYQTQVLRLRDLFEGQIRVRDFRQPVPPSPNVASVPDLSPSEVEELRSAHVGAPLDSLAGDCVAIDQGDEIARGYVTFDALPRDPDDVPPTEEGLENTLFADATLLERKLSRELPVAHLEMTDEGLENLGVGHGVHYDASPTNRRGKPRGPSTEVIAWRAVSGLAPFACGSPPPPVPETQVVALEEDSSEAAGGRVQVCTPAPGTSEPATCFGRATQRLRVGSDELPVPEGTGWLYLNLNSVESENSYVAALHTDKRRTRSEPGTPMLAVECPARTPRPPRPNPTLPSL